MPEMRIFAGRSTAKAGNNLGIILKDKQLAAKIFRRPDLDLYDAYYESRQYDSLAKWTDEQCAQGEYLPIRKRKPLLIFNFAKVFASRISSKLLGKANFPKFNIEEDPDTTEFINLLIRNSGLRSKLLEPMRRTLIVGSAFVRHSLTNGQFKIEHYHSKYCFPEFDNVGNLEKIRIQYVYLDYEDLDVKGSPKKKWYKLELDKVKDTLYDNPEVSTDGEDEPDFKVVEEVTHALGFVQGEWLVTTEQVNTVDGPSLIEDAMPYIDELNYSLSQSCNASSYNQDPQLLLKNMDEDDIENLVRSSQKAWNLGREGDASLLEAGMSGVDAAMQHRDKISMSLQHMTRLVMLDPEKIVGSAQSAKAMEVLHGPMVELITELQPVVGKSIKNIVMKMAITTLIANKRGMPTPIVIPPGYAPLSLDLTEFWPPIFAMTMQDLQAKVSVATSAASANIISRETMTRWLADDFGIENIEEEIQKIADQPVINPFGAF